MAGIAAYGLSEDGLSDLVLQQAEIDSGLQEFMEDEVIPYWRSVSPVDSGGYAASVKVTKDAKLGKGEVGATDFKAAWIEFGTGEPGPTPVFAPGGKTAKHFGGTLGD